MPLGVEHYILGRGGRQWWQVFKPLMPLGVEHGQQSKSKPVLRNVFKPLMPLGVEHVTPPTMVSPYTSV